MKIVDNGNKNKLVHFSKLSCGDVFIMDGDVYLKSRYSGLDYVVEVKTGIIRYISHSQDVNVTPLPNAELNLNK